jgi:hypothetical protein
MKKFKFLDVIYQLNNYQDNVGAFYKYHNEETHGSREA